MKRIASILVACTIAQALHELRPGSAWTVTNNSYDGIVFLDSSTRPTRAAITTWLSNCQDAETQRIAAKVQARIDVRNTSLTVQQRLQALLILTDND